MKLIYTPIVIIITAVLVVLTTSCSGDLEASATLSRDVTAHEANNLIQANQGNSTFLILDIRTPEEFADGHIEGAINIDYRADIFKQTVNELNRNNSYLVYCRSGNRSRGALFIMFEMGFREIYHLATGTIGWAEAGFSVIK